jgi:uncharacterized protein
MIFPMTKLIRFFLAFLLIPYSTFAFDIPAAPNPPRLVNDLASVLSAEEVSQLEQKLIAFDKSSSNQIAIVLVNTLDGDDIESVANKWAREWGIGRAKKNNGVLVLCAMQDHKLRIEVGTGLEPVITDSRSGSVIRSILKPAFKAGNYYQGLNDAVDKLIAMSKGEFTNDETDSPAPLKGRRVFLIIIVIIVILIVISKGGNGRNNGRRFGSTYSSIGWMGGFGGGGFGGGSSGGGGGGGFGGFGGGGFSGGGSSGSW